MIDSIRITEAEKEALTRVKRKTGIESWNVLCRWAYLIGLNHQENNFILNKEKRDAIEIRWETFTGKELDLYTNATKLLYSKQAISNSEITPFDFIHSKLAIGIRILSKAALENNIFCFSNLLNKSL